MKTTSTGPNDELERSYEQLPYESGPHYPTHPDCLATVATLMGMCPADVPQARVLELGCGNGGNLIPMAAALSETCFLGIDLSPRQIGQGCELIREAGLENIELRAADLLELGAELGQFDYIICHGVYSWVPAEVRDKILQICRENLAPRGVAYVSYNTYPGWHFRGIAKDMLHFHTRHLQEPEQRLAEARGVLNFLVEAIPDNDSPYARVLRSEVEGFQKEPDYYLVHEFLDEINQPFYFYEFMESAARQGLQFLGEAWQQTRLDDLPPQTQQTIRDISPDLIHVEQYLDFLRQRTFRRTLLCHDAITLSRAPTLERVLEMSVSGLSMPWENGDEDAPSDVVRYRTAANQMLSTNHPMVKAVLARLWDIYPQHIPMRDLITELRAGFAERPGLPAVTDGDVAGTLVQCFLKSSVMLHVHPPCFADHLSELPQASPFCRLQARLGGPVADQRHRQFELNALDRQVLMRLDGKHDRQRLVKEMQELVVNGTLTAQMLLEINAQGPCSEYRGDVAPFVDDSLQRLLSQAFLIA